MGSFGKKSRNSSEKGTSRPSNIGCMDAKVARGMPCGGHNRSPSFDGALFPCVLLALIYNWLQVLGTAEPAQIDQRVRQQLHPIVPLLDTFKAEQQALEFVFPRKGPLDSHA